MSEISPELDPRSRMALIEQMLKRSNILRSTTPNANGQIVGGIYPHYVPPIADWTKVAFNNIDAHSMEQDALANIKLLNAQEENAIRQYVDKYKDLDPEDRS
jgi:hypothetical protein